MDKKSDKSRILINSVFISGSTVFNNLIFLIINIIIARYLSVEHFGEYTTALAFATFFSTLVNIGINQTLIRAINLESTLEREHFGNALIIKTSLAIIVYSAMALSLYFTNYNRNTIYLAFIFGLVRIGNEYLSVFYAVYEAKEKFILRSIFLVFFSLSFLLGTVIVVLHKGNYFHFAYIRLFIVILFIVILILVTMRHFSIRFDITTIRKFTRSAIPFSLATIYTNIRQRISLIILSLMEGTRETGIFNNGAIFFSTLEIIPGSVNRVMLPYLYKVSYSENADKFQFSFDITSKAFGIMSFYLFLFFFLYSDTLIILIFGEKYREAIPILRIIAFGIPLIFNNAGTIIIALDLTKYFTRFTGIASLINIIGNIFFIKFFQTEGAAFALLLTNLIIFLLSHGFLYNRNLIKLRKVATVYLRLILIAVICCTVFHFLLRSISYTYSFFIISFLYISLVVLLLIRRDDVRILLEAMGLRKGDTY